MALALGGTCVFRWSIVQCASSLLPADIFALFVDKFQFCSLSSRPQVGDTITNIMVVGKIKIKFPRGNLVPKLCTNICDGPK